MSIQTKTWPYGKVKKATMVRSRGPNYAQFVLDEDKEMHILMRGAGDDSAKVGDIGTITFTEGGPTGGYWKFKRDEK